jgi:hypothetical protein
MMEQYQKEGRHAIKSSVASLVYLVEEKTAIDFILNELFNFPIY